MKTGRTMERSEILVKNILEELKLEIDEGLDFNQFVLTCCQKKEK